MRFGYLHLPFLGPESQWAAEASECANGQNAFWEYHDLLFARQSGENRDAFALELKLNGDQFNACVDSGKYPEQVLKDGDATAALGINSTRNFLINGRAVSGTQPFTAFQSIIEAEKKKAL